jgi:hypothetical protein
VRKSWAEETRAPTVGRASKAAIFGRQGTREDRCKSFALLVLGLLVFSAQTAEAQEGPGPSLQVGAGLGIVGTQDFLDNVDTGARAHALVTRSIGRRVDILGRLAFAVHSRPVGCFPESTCSDMAGFVSVGLGPSLTFRAAGQVQPFISAHGGLVWRVLSESGTGWYASFNPGMRIPLAPGLQFEIGLDLAVLGLARTVRPFLGDPMRIRDHAQTAALTLGFVKRLGPATPGIFGR